MSLGPHRSELNTWRLTSPTVHRIDKGKCSKNYQYSIAVENHEKICVQLSVLECRNTMRRTEFQVLLGLRKGMKNQGYEISGQL